MTYETGHWTKACPVLAAQEFAGMARACPGAVLAFRFRGVRSDDPDPINIPEALAWLRSFNASLKPDQPTLDWMAPWLVSAIFLATGFIGRDEIQLHDDPDLGTRQMLSAVLAASTPRPRRYRRPPGR